MPTALITGASAGLGHALAAALAGRGWSLVVDGHRADRLADAAADLGRLTTVRAVPGSVADPAHRSALVSAVRDVAGGGAAGPGGSRGRLDLLVHNASELGGSPPPPLRALAEDDLRRILEVNVVAPLALTRALLEPLAAAHGVVLSISSDAAVEHYEGWGGYGASKAALDHLTATFAAEQPDICWYAVDPGDMRTEMHQAAFPGTDISDLPDPATVVPALLGLLDRRPASGRYRAAQPVAS